jgi:hypothetical protein
VQPKLLVQPENNDILKFLDTQSSKSDNDSNNKIRENIIANMNYIDVDYFSDVIYGAHWSHLKEKFDESMKKICPIYYQYKIKHKAGRKNNYDFEITFLNEKQEKLNNVKLEFKYNASTINETPQFVSPMKPSQYLQNSFEEYYYEKYIVSLFNKFELEIPEKINYLKTIHNNAPTCVKTAQQLYYQGCKQSSKYTGQEKALEFYNDANRVSKECIKVFIENNDLNINDLSEYLLKSQKEKKYLLYKNNSFFIQSSNTDDDFIIESYVKKPEKFRYEAITKSNKKLNILLRWKNGNGIAYPAFQIS